MSVDDDFNNQGTSTNFNLFNLGDKEYYYRSSRYAEANWLQGVPVIYTPALGYDTDVNNDPIPKYGDPIQIYVLFLQMSKATLEKKNWITEGESALELDLSAIHFPRYKKWRNEGSDLNKVDEFLIPVGRYSKIKMPYKMTSSGSNDYTVMNIQGDAVRPLIWQCQIAPQRQQTDIKPETSEIDTSLNPQSDSNLSTSLLRMEEEDNDTTIEDKKQ